MNFDGLFGFMVKYLSDSACDSLWGMIETDGMPEISDTSYQLTNISVGV